MTLKTVLDNYKQCKGKNLSSDTKNIMANNMYSAYADMMNQLQDTANRDDTYLDKEIQKKRVKLDRKIQEIYNLDNGYLGEYKAHYESSIMSGLFWGTLVASVMYILFKRM